MTQLYIVSTDIACPRRLRRAGNFCLRWGERIQESVYLIEVDPLALYHFQAGLTALISAQHDTVRYYPICEKDRQRSQGLGLNTGLQHPPGHWLI